MITVQANTIKGCIKICVDHEIIKLADIDFINVFILWQLMPADVFFKHVIWFATSPRIWRDVTY